MSYIRGNSNPEKLYIIASTTGRLEIFVNQKFYHMPQSVFHGLLKKYLDEDRDEDNVRYKGARLSCIHVDKTTEMWQLSYKNWSFNMYEATLYYLARKNEFRWNK